MLPSILGRRYKDFKHDRTKCTENLFVLDFFNEVGDIKGALDEVGVDEWHEVEHFNQQFFVDQEDGKLCMIIQLAEHGLSRSD